MAGRDWNHNGRKDAFDRFMNYQLYKHFVEKDTSIFDDDEDDLFLDSSSDTSWRDDCEDGSEYGIFPEDYDTEDEYTEALEEEKYEWREYCEDGLEYGIDPEDYETEDEYIEALDEAELEAEELEELDFPNKRRYIASLRLANEFGCYNDEQIERFKFILEKGDTILAANYLSPDGAFLYAQAVKEHFTLPIDLPDEDETRECDFDEMIYQIAEKNIPLSLEVWDWCLKQFLPYAQYTDLAENFMTNFVINRLDDFPDGYTAEVVRYMDKHSDFREKIVTAPRNMAYDFPNLIVVAIEEKLFNTAKAMFVDTMNKYVDTPEVIIALTESVFRGCRNYDEFESMKYFSNMLLQLVKKCEDEEVQAAIQGWEKEIADYMVEQDIQSGEMIYTYCGVKFPNTSYLYSYRTDDSTIKVGDTVIVPIGRDNQEVKAKVVSVGQYARIAVPFPVEKTKFILRKCEE